MRGGIWLSEERRRIGNVDMGRTIYLGLPYYGRWLLAAARILVDKHHIALGELTDRIVEVKARYEGGLDGKTLDARPKFEGDGSQVNATVTTPTPSARATHSVFAGQAGQPKFQVGDPVLVRELPALFYTRTPEYVRGATGEIARRLRKRRRRGRDLGPTRPAAGMVLHRSVQPLAAVAWLHRDLRRLPADRDTRTLAASSHLDQRTRPFVDCCSGRKALTWPITLTITPARLRPWSTRSPTSKSSRSLCGNCASKREIFTAEDHRRFTEFAEQIGPTPGAHLVARAWLDPRSRSSP